MNIIGLTRKKTKHSVLFAVEKDSSFSSQTVDQLNGYLVPAEKVFVKPANDVPSDRTAMQFGNHPYYANALMLRRAEADKLKLASSEAGKFLRPLYGSSETINGKPRYCVWITESSLASANELPELARRIEMVRAARQVKTSDKQALKSVSYTHLTLPTICSV